MAAAFSIDRLLGGRLQLTQPADGYRVSIDAVLLAASIPAGDGDHVLDLGTGVGGAALCLATRVEGASVTGVDVDAGLIALAGDNARINRLCDRVHFLVADVEAPALAVAADLFDHAMANPPYLPAGRSRHPGHPGRATAMVESAASTLDTWAAVAARAVRSRGTVTFIHRADRLPDVLAAFAARFGELSIVPLWPGGRTGAEARRVLVRGRKGSQAPARLMPGLVLHQAGGRFTDAAEAILRHAAALAW
jgi:tRNA1(Val) A37 N6-methylase TrmN6